MIRLSFIFLVFAIGFFVINFFGCNQSDITADKTLQNYVEQRFDNNQSKTTILQKVTGALYLQIEQMNEEEFKNFSSTKNIKKKEFKILSSRCKNDQCYITYYLSYYNIDSSNKTEVITDVKKVAEVIKEDGIWKIKDIVNIKTYHKSLDELQITN
ncbi:MAG: hypothetical protein HQK51_07310 [Oligoflexia bacterium]|nr:hypothetical protein [Oligoflexia bacterium]